ncbi:DEAD/DEAH box helicase [Synergistaceae bacterium OttesenSCG-928-I11]|nr:DEAD/DEAH box helicase [Synergistaceae bacterium OttesenSCG-928-I11]
MSTLYEWQERAFEQIEGRNAILSAPTGSGKTWVAYRWAGLMKADGTPSMPEATRVIFTAPIKALSNERYLDLRKMGFDVGLETGDFKKNAGANVLCCTQEIYTLKYAHLPDQFVIVDEFHFIFGSPERTRAYIDGIRATNPDSMLLVMSATFGDPNTVRDYLEEMARRDFELFETKERVTKLVFRKKGIHYSRIRDALVFAFSKRGVEHTARQIAHTRKKIERADRARLREMAEILEVTRTPETLLYGVGVYYGSLFPKEKLLVEMAFRERILDVVVGTDALSLGVNLPAESVIFAQMAKYVDGPLTHNEFLQMAGRAGRKGYFETGYVSFIPRSKTEHHDFDTETLYREVLASPSEPATIALQPAVGKLLKGHVTVETEARMIADCSLPRVSFEQAVAWVEELLLLIQRTLGLIKNRDERKKLKEALADLWFDEMSVTGNFAVAHLFVKFGDPDAMMAAEVLRREERNYLQALLKIKRYAGRMPEGYKFSNMERIDATVERIDVTVFGFEEKIRQLDLTEDSWSF